MEKFGKLLILIGIILIITGIIFIVFKKIPFNLGKLPGDIFVEKENFKFYFPVVTCILISIILSIIMFIISKFFK